jgi:hypothetical protein
MRLPRLEQLAIQDLLGDLDARAHRRLSDVQSLGDPAEIAGHRELEEGTNGFWCSCAP